MERLNFLFDSQTPLPEIVARLLLAVFLGLGLGYERETRDKPAGLKTHMLVALAACTFTIVAIELVKSLAPESAAIESDPVRVIEAVTTGVAFLGAGAIIQSRGTVVGVTTGASIWLAGAIGLACGGGLYLIAVLVFVLALVILVGMKALERRFIRNNRGSGRNLR
jgi:putative Mg2+ transporter-C (MgtC) family protein